MTIFATGGHVLPAINSVTQAADFTTTVQPYIPQFYSLHHNLWSALTVPSDSTGRIAALQHVYLNTNPLIFAFWLSLFFSIFFFIGAEVNKNYSQVDRFWSLLPTFYNIHYAVWARANGLPTQRLDNVVMFSAIWSARLTFNYWRKGGYSIGSEDYRWETVKKYVGPVGMFIFDATFIAAAQNVLLWSITTPTYILLLHSRFTNEGMQTSDILFSRGLILLIILEFFADQQQWDYHQAKNFYKKNAKLPPNSKFTVADMERGFLVSGLWAWSRHPNFLAEQAVWVTLYQWGCFASNTFWNWTFVGAVSYLILFQSSTWLTELLSAQKYPEYKEYQQLVGKFLPSLLGSSSRQMKDDPALMKKAQ